MAARPAAARRSADGASAEHPSGDARFKMIDRTLKRFQYQQDALIEVLHTAQESFGYLSEDLMIYVAQQLKLPMSWVYGVATFYHFFTLEPQGEHSCTICMGTACYVKRAAEIVAKLQDEYGIEPGETTPDGKFSAWLPPAASAVAPAPVIVLDGEVMGRLSPDEVLDQVRSGSPPRNHNLSRPNHSQCEAIAL